MLGKRRPACRLYFVANTVTAVLLRDRTPFQQHRVEVTGGEWLSGALRELALALNISPHTPTTAVVDSSVAVVRPIAGLAGIDDSSIVASAIDASRSRYFLDAGTDLLLSRPVRLPDGNWSVATFDIEALNKLDNAIAGSAFSLRIVVPWQQDDSVGDAHDDRYAVDPPSVTREFVRRHTYAVRTLFAVGVASIVWACAAPSLYYLWLAGSASAQGSQPATQVRSRTDLLQRHQELSGLLERTSSRAAAPAGTLAMLATLVGSLPDSVVVLSASLGPERGRVTLLATSAPRVLASLEESASGVPLALAGPVSRETHQGVSYDRLALSWSLSRLRPPTRRASER